MNSQLILVISIKTANNWCEWDFFVILVSGSKVDVDIANLNAAFSSCINLSQVSESLESYLG